MPNEFKIVNDIIDEYGINLKIVAHKCHLDESDIEQFLKTPSACELDNKKIHSILTAMFQQLLSRLSGDLEMGFKEKSDVTSQFSRAVTKMRNDYANTEM